MKNDFRPGDLIGFSSWGWSGVVINLGSFSMPFVGLSHIGIVAEYNKVLCLYESTTLLKQPCLHAGVKTTGAQVHDIESRIKKYRGLVYHIPINGDLTDHEHYKLRNFLYDDLGKPYDMLGAIRSGGKMFATIQGLLRQQDLNNLFCSEWVIAALAHIGRFRPRNASSYNPSAAYHALHDDFCHMKARLIHIPFIL